MSYLKFNGVINEIIERYPNIDVIEFLQEKLQLPTFKAEELATRIEKEYCLKDLNKIETNNEIENLEESNNPKIFSKTGVYSVDILSEKEFEHFTKWLLEELGYEVHPERFEADLGSEFVASKDDQKIVILTRGCPKDNKVSNVVVLKTVEAGLICGCSRSIVIAPSYFSQQALLDARKLGVELWDKDTLTAKIEEIRKNTDMRERSCFPPYKGSLLQSLLRLEETKDFIIEPKADEKYDLHLPGVKYPLLTFQACDEEVIRCVYRIKYNEPVGEFDGEAIIRSDHNNDRYGPNGIHAYELIIQYLEQFVE